MDDTSVAHRQPTHAAVCPICGAPAASEVTWPNEGLIESAFLCSADKRHAWTTKWLEAAA